MSMKKIGLLALRLVVGLVFAFVWSAFCILTGIKQSYFAIYGYGVVGFFAFGMWLSKRWVGTKPGSKYDYETWPVRQREQVAKEETSSSQVKAHPYLDRLNELAEMSKWKGEKENHEINNPDRRAGLVNGEVETIGKSKSEPSFMNQKQKKILIATSALIVILVLFPPFQMEYPTRMIMNLGYGFLFYPPETYAGSGYRGSVNTGLLLAEVVIAVLAGGLLAFAFKDKNN